MALDDPRWTFEKVSQAELKTGGEERALRLAQMSHSTIPDFYDLVPAEPERVIAMIADQLGAKGTETANLYVLGRNGEDVAVVATLPCEAVDYAKQVSTLEIVRSLGGADRATFIKRLGGYTASVEPIDLDGVYLNRIAVGAHARRSGVGSEAMRRFVDLADGKPLVLHVKADNDAAISLYQKFGFGFLSDGPHRFRAMTRR